jgi:hypothetical protein
MVLYRLLTISGEFQIFLIRIDLQPYIHNEFDSRFLFDLLVISIFSFLYSILIRSEGNVVNYITAKHNLSGIWCYLHRCEIGASNNLLTMRLIEGSNQIDYLLDILVFHDCFQTQMI